MASILRQLRINAIALLSLVVALSSFSYTAWRTDRSESNRTTREAAFRLLTALGAMQEVVYRAHYDHDENKGNPRTGWVYVQTISDFSSTMPEPVPREAQSLLVAWREHWEGLGRRDEDADAIDDAILACRAAVVIKLRALR